MSRKMTGRKNKRNRQKKREVIGKVIKWHPWHSRKESDITHPKPPFRSLGKWTLFCVHFQVSMTTEQPKIMAPSSFCGITGYNQSSTGPEAKARRKWGLTNSRWYQHQISKCAATNVVKVWSCLNTHESCSWCLHTGWYEEISVSASISCSFLCAFLHRLKHQKKMSTRKKWNTRRKNWALEEMKHQKKSNEHCKTTTF